MTPPAPQKKLAIDVVSDVVCPWCYIGKRRLEAALASLPDLPVEVRWRPFQLDPTIPAGGIDRRAYMEKKFGAERYREISAQISATGTEVGIAFAFADIKRAPNTLDAHRLIRWAETAGVQGAVKEHLMRLFFVEGGDIGDREVLVGVARAHGMDAAVVARLLNEGTDIDAVREEIISAQKLGISGVPFFILAGQLGISGAQTPEVLRSAILEAVALAAQATDVKAT